MLGRGAKAEPAKVEPARLRSSHVHATAVLLDWALALGTRLGIGQYPIRVLGLGAGLGHLPFHCAAIHWPVSFLGAVPAEIVGAIARGVEVVTVHFMFDRLFATRRRIPLCLLTTLNMRSNKVRRVHGFKIISNQGFVNNVGIDYGSARRERTL